MIEAEIELQILLKNVLNRFKAVSDGGYVLNGEITNKEMDAINIAAKAYISAELRSSEPTQRTDKSTSDTTEKTHLKDPRSTDPQTDSSAPSLPETQPETIDPPSIHDQKQKNTIDEPLQSSTKLKKNYTQLVKETLDLEPGADNVRICLDFGTAMSKATLIEEDRYFSDEENIEVIPLGVPTDQEEISENMLMSSVFIGDDGIVYFGQFAVDMSLNQPEGSQRQRIDNIKRYLSEDALHETIGSQFDPTSSSLIFEDMILAYLAYFTWAVNEATAELGYPKNTQRRFAMPCFDKGKQSKVASKLKKLLGQAQILADTFADQFNLGIELDDLMNAIKGVRSLSFSSQFIGESITEPLGVAGSLISWHDNVNSLIMVIDVGAGTSDLSLYRLKFDPKTQKSVALEVKGASRGITEAGNYLDRLLQAHILRQARIDSSDSMYRNTLGALELRLREYKESLFTDGFVIINLFNGVTVEIELEDFTSLPQVEKFSNSLRNCMESILNDIDPSFVRGAPNGALGIALTGGGAQLPMVKSLAQGELFVHNHKLKLVQTQSFPKWLEEDYPELEAEYPRIAVSIGGARKKILVAHGPATVTCDPVGERTLETF
ncbi:hypothetical protein [Vibrio breoganii]|uniref:hypothetical protein n=1 Tax=Vibrio breoganii TaxID=553239 RepID=UPI000C8456B5|nr:hypothetical protein [Vibrio breoganii]